MSEISRGGARGRCSAKDIFLTLLRVSGLLGESPEAPLSPLRLLLTALLITLSPELQKHSRDLRSLAEFGTSLRKETGLTACG